MLSKKIGQKLIIIFSIPFLSFTFYCNENVNPENPSDIKLPAGFKIEVFADNIPNARSLTLGENGVVFVGTRDNKVYAVIDNDENYIADTIVTIASGLNTPNGVAFKDGNLYVAEISKVWRYDNILNNLQNPPDPVLVSNGFPSDTHHGWKFIAFGPDNKLYVPVGAPCNICLRDDDERFSSIMRMNADGSELEVFAHGIRNTVGFAWHPETQEIWFTDNGRDMLGDNVPPDELNRAPSAGMHFGYPFVHGGDIRDPEFGEGVDINQYVKPVQKLGPHVAALGMRFYTGNMFPEEYRDQIFIAEHGSWNRSKKIGYRVMLVKLEGNEAVSYEPFAEGWLHGDAVSGRPVDVLVLPDGSLLVSDDYGGMIYRISYAD
ncbi:MAG: sorbosone dehydrogenase family protein [Ignavibacteriales bacterium]|nr:MAG: sorbosone dehydrogenase family protein [Ignavibacteriales bacterium]